jgi:hypothetical protein
VLGVIDVMFGEELLTSGGDANEKLAMRGVDKEGI